MKIVQINSCNFGSTGNIMLSIAERLKNEGKECRVVVPAQRGNYTKKIEKQMLVGSRFSRNLHLLLGKITGYNGCFSFFSTKRLVKKIDSYKPDVIHLHNLHNCYINLPLLFKYIKKHQIRVIWTLHDCWPFTGHCPYFTMAQCEKWKNGCCDCPSYKAYPQSLMDNSRKMYRLKKKWFTGVKDLTIVTPSQWLSDLVKQSFLQEYPVQIINNGIDLSVFKPTESNFREKYNIPKQKKILLGVAFGWGERKGLDVFLELANRLDPKVYQIVLVGTDATVDGQLPDNIISIHRTQNQSELAQLYTAADLFVNPTREEVFGLVNVEALACGTPVITFKTGGSPECIDETCGTVVECDDVETLIQQIVRICSDNHYSKEACLMRAENFNKDKKFKEYIELYEQKSNEQ